MGLFSGDASHDDFLKLEARVTQLESAVARLTALGSAGPAAAGAAGDPTGAAPWVGEVRALKEQGQAIQAIKRVRELTGWGLKEAKDYVDGL